MNVTVKSSGCLQIGFGPVKFKVLNRSQLCLFRSQGVQMKENTLHFELEAYKDKRVSEIEIEK